MAPALPKLFFNTGKDDRQAVREVVKSGLACDLIGPIADERTPFLIVGSMRLYGTERIREFILAELKSASPAKEPS